MNKLTTHLVGACAIAAVLLAMAAAETKHNCHIGASLDNTTLALKPPMILPTNIVMLISPK